jgi:hypothetical protein
MANPNIVSVTSIYGETLGHNLTATLTTTIMTVAAEKLLKINFISVANVDGTNAATFNLYITKAGFTSAGVGSGDDTAGDMYLAKTVNVPADDIMIVLDKPLYLMELDVLKGGASAAGDLDLLISYEVINDA